MNFTTFFIIFSFVLLAVPKASAQDQLIWKADMDIDASFSDWRKDSLDYFYEEQGLKYAISNDDTYLYVFIQVPHQGQQLKAIYNGFNITVNQDAKEKDGSSVIFPLPDKAALRAVNEESNMEKAINRRQFGIESVRAIFVHGFSGVVDGMISINNNYGIEPAIKIDSSDILNYELAISLDQLGLEPGAPFAINLRINEVITTRYTDPGYRRYRYGYPYYGMGRYSRSRPRSGISRKEVPGAWHTFTLATQQK